VEGETIVVTTQCRACKKVSAVKLRWPPKKEQFPRECDACGLARVGPAPDGLLDSMAASFDASLAQQRAMATEPVD